MKQENKGIIELFFGIIGLPLSLYLSWQEFYINTHMPPNGIYYFSGIMFLVPACVALISTGYVNYIGDD